MAVITIAGAPKHDRTSYMPSRSKKAWGGGEGLALSPKRTGCVEKCTSRVRRVLVRTRARSVESAESMGGMVD